MVESIRKDLFDIDAIKGMEPGYVVLRTTADAEENQFLRTLLVERGNGSRTVNSDGPLRAIADEELYRSISDGDIGFINQRGQIRTVLSQKANHNTVLVTEQCDNLCKFCSQPPKKRDDEWLMVQSALAICAYNSTATIGVSGGEPTLNRKQFVRFLKVIQLYAKSTPLHILSNGRSFSDVAFLESVVEASKGLNITYGIPLYGVNEKVHDSLVSSDGAYQDTQSGLINAGNMGLNIELRVIPTRENIDQIVGIVEMALRSLSNVVQVSIMNLEPTGWAKKNWTSLYVNPSEYQWELGKALDMAKMCNLPIKLFNYPLCHLEEGNRAYAVKSISDWKNYYPSECGSCILKPECSGYFTSSKGKYHQIARRLL